MPSGAIGADPPAPAASGSYVNETSPVNATTEITPDRMAETANTGLRDRHRKAAEQNTAGMTLKMPRAMPSTVRLSPLCDKAI